ncbi:MAG: class I SAM-dependent methyltransferase [Bacteroidales bacterium]|nr:class I SAM-dependent methyltransferase [Bacteroidales bacterium]
MNTGLNTFSQIEINNPFQKEKIALDYEQLLKAPFARQIRRDETKLLTQLFQENLSKDDIVLEIGAGTGYYSLTIASLVKHLTAIEPAKGMAQQLREKATLHQITNIELHEKYFEQFDSAFSFDHVIAIGVLDYITNPNVFIERCLSLSKKKFIFTAPHRGLWTLFYKMGALFQQTKIYRYSKKDLKQLLPNSMLQIDDVGLKSSLTRGFSLICMASGVLAP